ncbi:MAG: helix-turn-helix transcriptional regulator [Elusimicrobia bacterium]|nr:helix-turn-helix transcriptional regulator [Elusimicrobiota bacterium]
MHALRCFRGISQRHLAETAGIDQAVIARLERGGDARWTTLQSLFGAFGFDAVRTPSPSSEDAKDGAHARKDRVSLNKMFSKRGNPDWKSIVRVMVASKLRLRVEPAVRFAS